MAGTLYLCATPIGNLEDITYRVISTLQSVDLIAAEDTRHSRKLLEHFDIHKPLTSYHEHNKFEKADALVEKLLEGQNVALVTDAGTPAISDPGEVLVRRCHEAGVPVTSLPGACACITALTLSGLSTRRFAFEAFLPVEGKERKAHLDELAVEKRTMILYEAPHRLRRTLADLCASLGEGRAMRICRELTKLHEETQGLTLGEAVRLYEDKEPRGEYVLVIEGKPQGQIEEEKKAKWESMSFTEHLEMYLSQGLDRKDAMKRMAADRGCGKRDIYRALLEEEEA